MDQHHPLMQFSRFVTQITNSAVSLAQHWLPFVFGSLLILALFTAVGWRPSRAQQDASLDLFEQVLAAAQTSEERQSVAQVFLIWQPSIADQPTSAGVSVRELAKGTRTPQAQTTNPLPLDDGTPAQIYFYQVKQRLPVEIQTALEALAAADIANLDKTVSDDHFEVHYTTTSGSPDTTSDAYANKVLDYLSKAYDTEITSWGYKSGASQDKAKYQVFIQDLGGAYGNTRDFVVNTSTDPQAVRTYTTIGIAPTLTDDSLLLGSLAHEYHHASQSAYMKSTGMKLWIMESSTAWIEYQVRKQYPSVTGNSDWNLFKQRAEYFQTHSSWGLLSVKADKGDVTNDYDASIWWWFLINNTKTGDLSGTGTARNLNRVFWEKLAQKADWNKIIESFDDALVTADYDTMSKAFGHFLTASVLPAEWLPTGTEAIRKANTQQIQLDTVFANNTETSYTAAAGGTPDIVGHYGEWDFELLPGSTRYDFSVAFDGDNNTNFIVKLITLQNGAFQQETTLSLDANRDGQQETWTLDPAHHQTGILVVARTDDTSGSGGYKLTLRTSRNIAFVIDDTGSMGDDIDAVKQTVLAKIDEMAARSKNWTWSLITFKDDVTVHGSTSDPATIKGWISNLYASGGGDCPEDSLDALRQVPAIAPRAEVWLFTDASPHGGPFALATTLLSLSSQHIKVNPFILGWCWGSILSLPAHSSLPSSSNQGQDGQICPSLPGPNAPLNKEAPRIPVTTTQNLSRIPTEAELKAKADAAIGAKRISPWVTSNLSRGVSATQSDGTDVGVYFNGYYSILPQGQATQYVIYAYTNNFLSATNTVLTLTLPPDVSYVTYTVAYPDQVGGNLSPVVDGSDVVWTPGTVPASESGYPYWYQYFYVDALVAPDAVAATTLATVTISTTDNEIDYANNTTSVSQQVVEPAPDLYVYKYRMSPDPSGVIAGATLRYYVAYANYGDSPAHNVVLTDSLPSGTTFITSTWYDSMMVNGQDISLDVGTVPAGGYNDLYVDVQLSEPVPIGTVLTNTVMVTTSNTNRGSYPTTFTAVDTVVSPTVDMSVYKYLYSASWGAVVPTGELWYFVGYYNAGNSPATGVHLTDTLPSGVDFITTTRTDMLTVSGNTLSWGLDTVPPGYSDGQYILVRVLTDTAVGTILTNTAGVSANELEMEYANNTAVDVRAVDSPTIDLSVGKYTDYPQYLPGENITYTVWYVNNGSWPANSVRVTDTLLPGMAYAGSTLTPTRILDGQVVWDLGTVERGTNGSFILYTRQSTAFAMGDWITNTVSIDGQGAAERNPDDNTSYNLVYMGERDGLLSGGEPYAQLADGTGGHYFELPGASSSEMAEAADIALMEMASDASLNRYSFIVTDTAVHTNTLAVDVDGLTSQANFLLNGQPDSNLSLKLVEPNGQILPSSPELASMLSVSHTVVRNSDYYEVFNPTPGRWQMVISGTGSYVASSSGNTPLTVQYLGDTSLGRNVQALAKVRVEGPVGTIHFSFVRADGSLLRTTELYDDGAHGDGGNRDGLYAGTWTPISSEPHYLKAAGTDSGGHPFERVDTTPIRIQSLSVVGPEGRTVLPADTVTYTIAINNSSASGDTYNVTYTSSHGWIRAAGLPGVMTVAAGATVSIMVPIEVPGDAKPGTLDQLSVSAISQADTNLSDRVDVFTLVGSAMDLSIGLQVNVTSTVSPPCMILPCSGLEAVSGLVTVPVNGLVTYTVVYSGSGDATATGLVITGSLPAKVIYLADSSGVTPDRPGAGQYVWAVPDLLPYNQRSFTIWGLVRSDAIQGEIITSAVQIGTTAVDPISENNEAKASFLVRGVIYLPPVQVTISGAPTGTVGAAYSFTAATASLAATSPLTYIWEATGRPPVTHTNQLSDTVVFTWLTPGLKVVHVSARNAGGQVTGSYNINIFCGKRCTYLPLVQRR